MRVSDKGSADRSTEVYEELRGLIVRGAMAPGTRVVETDVAERLGVSRTPVRAAIQQLEHEGYIITSGSGRSRSTVAPLTRQDSRELFYIIGEVEGLAARWAAQLDAPARETVVASLREVNGRLAAATEPARPDQDLIFTLDGMFHRTYVEAGAGPRLLALHDAIKPQADRYTRVYINALVDEIPTSVDEHDRIVHAVATGQADEAQAATQTNWRNAARRLAQVIDRRGERGSW